MNGRFDLGQIRWPYLVALVLPPAIVLSAYYLVSDPVPHLLSPFLNSDGFFYAYHAWYSAVVDASGGVTAQLIPTSLYTSYLSVIFETFGFSPLALYLGNGLLFLSSSVLMAEAARHLFGFRAALISSGLFALSAPLIFFTGTTMKTILVVFLFAGLTYFAARFIRSRSLLWSLLTVPVIFLAAIDRHNSVVLLPAVFLLTLFHAKVSPGRAFAAFVVTAFASFALMSSIVNWELDELEPSFNAPMGLNFYVGNNERANGGYTSVRGLSDDLYGHRIGIGPYTERLAGRDMSRQEISAFWLGKSFHFINEQPAKYAELQLKKMALLVSQYAYGSPEQLAVWREQNLVLQLAFVDYSVLIALATIGLVLAWPDHRPTLLFLAGAFGLYAFSIWVFFVTERYKLPLYVFLLPLAAVGLERLISARSIGALKLSVLASLLYGLSVTASSGSTPLLRTFLKRGTMCQRSVHVQTQKI